MELQAKKRAAALAMLAACWGSTFLPAADAFANNELLDDSTGGRTSNDVGFTPEAAPAPAPAPAPAQEAPADASYSTANAPASAPAEQAVVAPAAPAPAPAPAPAAQSGPTPAYASHDPAATKDVPEDVARRQDAEAAAVRQAEAEAARQAYREQFGPVPEMSDELRVAANLQQRLLGAEESTPLPPANQAQRDATTAMALAERTGTYPVPNQPLDPVALEAAAAKERGYSAPIRATAPVPFANNDYEDISRRQDKENWEAAQAAAATAALDASGYSLAGAQQPGQPAATTAPVPDDDTNADPNADPNALFTGTGTGGDANTATTTPALVTGSSGGSVQTLDAPTSRPGPVAPIGPLGFSTAPAPPPPPATSSEPTSQESDATAASTQDTVALWTDNPIVPPTFTPEATQTFAPSGELMAPPAAPAADSGTENAVAASAADTSDGSGGSSAPASNEPLNWSPPAPDAQPTIAAPPPAPVAAAPAATSTSSDARAAGAPSTTGGSGPSASGSSSSPGSGPAGPSNPLTLSPFPAGPIPGGAAAAQGPPPAHPETGRNPLSHFTNASQPFLFGTGDNRSTAEKLESILEQALNIGGAGDEPQQRPDGVLPFAVAAAGGLISTVAVADAGALSQAWWMMILALYSGFTLWGLRRFSRSRRPAIAPAIAAGTPPDRSFAFTAMMPSETPIIEGPRLSTWGWTGVPEQISQTGWEAKDFEWGGLLP